MLQLSAFCSLRAQYWGAWEGVARELLFGFQRVLLFRLAPAWSMH